MEKRSPVKKKKFAPKMLNIYISQILKFKMLIEYKMFAILFIFMKIKFKSEKIITYIKFFENCLFFALCSP